MSTLMGWVITFVVFSSKFRGVVLGEGGHHDADDEDPADRNITIFIYGDTFVSPKMFGLLLTFMAPFAFCCS